MVETYAKCFNVKDFVFLYSSEDMITNFSVGIRLSNNGHEDDMILEPCSDKEKANMATLGGSLTPYLYLHVLVIYDLGVFIPFTLFKVQFLETVEVSHSQITPNI